MRQFEAKGVTKLACVEARVSRAFGGGRVVGGCDGLDRFGLDLDRLAGFDRFANDEAGVVAPVGFTAGNAMVGAVGKVGFCFAFALPLANELGGNIGEKRGRGRGAPLVGDDAEALTLSRKFEHGLGEVGAVGTDDPTGAQDQVARVGFCEGKLAVALGAAVDALRVGRIGFAVGAVLDAVEDVIGGVMHDQRADLRRFFTENARCDGVDRGSTSLITLGLVNGGVGSRVDDDIGAHRSHQLANGLRIRQIAVGEINRNDFAQRREAALQFEADLAILAGEEDFHGRALIKQHS